VIASTGVPLRDALAAGAQVFEVVRDHTLHETLNRLSFYTWGDAGCCLPRGSTRATLRGAWPELRAGDFLALVEVASPTPAYGAEDADRMHRHVVRLTRVNVTTDPSGRLFDDPPVDAAVDITEIEWDGADALPFPLCLSVTERPGLEVSVALGNIVLADHGATVRAESLGQVPAAVRRYASTAPEGDRCERQERAPVPPRFRPALAKTPLAHGFDLAALLDEPVDDPERLWSASAFSRLSARDATPLVTSLIGTQGAQSLPWTAQRDLLASAGNATDFVVEVENSGVARLRFGDDVHGRRPDEGTQFVAAYRVGNGPAGNVGAQAIAHVVTDTLGVFSAVSNPQPAFGGTASEDVQAAQRDAPHAFRTQERAVTPTDYAAAAERRPEVQHAAATLRWTGSWHTVFVTADRIGGAAVDASFEARLRAHLERFRMAGYDLEVDAPRYVPLDVALHVCVLREHFRAQVLQAVRDVLSSRLLPDGRLGLFHPDNFSFGESVYASRIVAAAQAVQGVEAVRLEKFQRLIDPRATSKEDGVIPIGRLEIAQLENNPNFRERGRLVLSAGGGK
jgi:hypothetical protein